MGKTIIQTIGPLYGEVVNGTVFGRPNGSIFVPISNTISISLADSTKYVRTYTIAGTKVYTVCASSGGIPNSNPSLQLKIVAESQDVQNYIVLQVSADNFDNVIGTRNLVAGRFNNLEFVVSNAGTRPDIVNGDTYYLRAVLMSASGSPVATSETIELTGVVPE